MMRLVFAVLALALVAGRAGAAPAAPVLKPPRPPANAPAAPPVPAAEIEKFLPAGTVQGDVMDVATDPRYDAIVAKMRAAIMRQPEWWQSYASKNADAHGVVPWDARLGVTKAEYDDMMAMARKLHLSRIASTTLTFKRGAGGEIVMDGGTAAPELTGLRFSRDRQSVSSAYGVLTSRQDVHQTDPAAPSGVLHGVGWACTGKDEKTGNPRVAFLAVGRMASSNRGLMFLSLREMVNGKVDEKSRIVTYPIAAR